MQVFNLSADEFTMLLMYLPCCIWEPQYPGPKVDVPCSPSLCLQALFSNFGYTYLDVRPSLELEEVGKVKGSVNISLVNATRKYSSEKKKKVLQKEDNPNFIQEVSHHCLSDVDKEINSIATSEAGGR